MMAKDDTNLRIIGMRQASQAKNVYCHAPNLSKYMSHYLHK